MEFVRPAVSWDSGLNQDIFDHLVIFDTIVVDVVVEGFQSGNPSRAQCDIRLIHSIAHH